MGIVIAGFLMGLSLIVAIGPQNALILKQGMLRQGVIPVLVVCMVSDIILVLGGTAGVGALVGHAPIMLTVLKWCGVMYLLIFAGLCFRDARRTPTASRVIDEGEGQSPASAPPASPTHGGTTVGGTAVAVRERTSTRQRTKAWRKPVLAALAFTWLNPAAFVDTLIMLGGMANQYGPTNRWLFAAGALIASMLWFPTIGYVSVRCSSVLNRPGTWRWINVAVGCIMLILCGRLLAH